MHMKYTIKKEQKCSEHPAFTFILFNLIIWVGFELSSCMFVWTMLLCSFAGATSQSQRYSKKNRGFIVFWCYTHMSNSIPWLCILLPKVSIYIYIVLWNLLFNSLVLLHLSHCHFCMYLDTFINYICAWWAPVDLPSKLRCPWEIRGRWEPSPWN